MMFSICLFVLEKMVKTVDTLTKDLNCLFLGEILAFFDVGVKISAITVLEDEVVIVRSLLHIVEFDDITAFTALEHFDFALK